jgi:hypothetical protein
VLLATIVHASRQTVLVVLVAALYVAGTLISIPGASDVLESLMRQRASGPGPSQFFTVFLLGGGQVSWGTVFTLGINPYISAAFLVTLAQIVWSWLRRDAGHRRRLPVVRLTWCVAIVLTVTQAAGFASFLERVSANGAVPIVATPGWRFEDDGAADADGGNHLPDANQRSDFETSVGERDADRLRRGDAQRAGEAGAAAPGRRSRIRSRSPRCCC